jgi:S1-C subfamily serine protease
LASNSGINPPAGLLVQAVNSGGVGEEAGISKGDMLININGTPIRSMNDKEIAMSVRKPHVPVRLQLSRGDGLHFVALEVD